MKPGQPAPGPILLKIARAAGHIKNRGARQIEIELRARFPNTRTWLHTHTWELRLVCFRRLSQRLSFLDNDLSVVLPARLASKVNRFGLWLVTPATGPLIVVRGAFRAHQGRLEGADLGP